MSIKTNNAILRSKIIAGIRKAVRNLVERKAAENGTLVVLVNGKPAEVPAKELLKRTRQ
jgi:hypothetical protein